MYKAAVKIRQLDQSDCGIACLISVARYFGVRLSREKLKLLAGTNNSGTTLAGLVDAAEKSGFLAKGAKGTAESLSVLQFPVIAHVILKNGLHHYVVIYRCRSGYVRFMDPADGKLHKISIEGFLQIWTGILLLLTPGSGPFPDDKEFTAGRLFINILKPEKNIFFRMFLGSVLYMVLGFSSTFYLRNITDLVWQGSNTNLLNLLSIAMIALLLIQTIISVFRNLIGLYIANSTDKRIILGYLQRLLQLPHRFFETIQTGEIISRINDAVKIRVFLNETIIALAVNILLLLCTAVIMFFTNWKLAVISMTVIPVYGVFFIISMRFNSKWSRKIMEQSAALEATLVERIAAIQLIKRFDLGHRFISLTSEKINPLLRTVYVSGRFSTWHGTVVDFFTKILTVVLLWKGSEYVLGGTLSPGELLSFYTLIGVFTDSASVLTTAPKSIEDARNAAKRLISVYDSESEEHDIGNSASKPDSGSITIKNLSFAYPGRGVILNDISLDIPASALVAVVGKSGCGKSTLIALIQRLYEPSNGRILCGNTDLKLFSLRALRHHIGIVPQQTELFSESVIENIAPGTSQPQIENIINICQLLEIDEFISNLPAGYLTHLSNAGSSLSGGQKQRIAIARALYRDPKILLLDEPTANLDPRSTAAIISTLRHYRQKGMTIVIVTHNKELLKLCDQVVFLESGKLYAKGEHSELLKNCPKYREMWRE